VDEKEWQMDTEIAFGWLRVWVDVNNPSFQNCIIDRSDNVCDRMNHVTEKIIILIRKHNEMNYQTKLRR
jgi:hypothetical protein